MTEILQSSSDPSPSPLESIELNPGLKFTVEERRRVNYLLELDRSNVISFNDLEYGVASKVRASYLRASQKKVYRDTGLDSKPITSLLY